MDNEVKEITFGRIIKVAFRNWKLFTPVAVVVALGVALGIHFGYNTLKGNYSSTFSYSAVDLSQEKYADGSDFYYRNLISPTNLNAIKASDEKYAGIDVDKILDKNGISVSKNDEKMTYTVTLSYKYIKNNDVAKSFVKDIAESPLKKDADIVLNTSFDSALKSYDKADTFEDQIRFLARQANFLTTSYDALTNQKTTETTKKVELPTGVIEQINTNKESITNKYNEDTFAQNLIYRVYDKGYVKDWNAQEAKDYELTQSLLTREKAVNEEKIDAIENEINNISSAAAISSLSQDMEKLILRDVEIDKEVEGITNKLGNREKQPSEIEGYEAFVANLSNNRTLLAQYTTDYKAVLKAAYVDGAEIAYENSSITKLNGTIGLAINAVISVVVGVVVGAVVNLIVDRKKLYE